MVDAPASVFFLSDIQFSLASSLRKRLGDTQQQFAGRLGMAISTVVRYELSRQPRGSAIAKLERLALQHGFKEEAGIFRKSLYKEFGITLIESETSVNNGEAPLNILQGPASQVDAAFPGTEREVDQFELDLSPYVFRGTRRGKELILDLLWAVKNSTAPDDSLGSIEYQLKSYRPTRRQYEEGLERALAQVLEISALKDRGLSTEEIVARLSLPTVNVGLSLRVSREIWRVLPEGESKEQKLRRFLFALPVGGAQDAYAEEYDEKLSAEYSVPVSAVRTFRRDPSKLGIPIPQKHTLTGL